MDDFSSEYENRPVNFTVTIAIQDIPDESIQEYAKEVEALCSGNSDLRRHDFSLLIYPNGYGKENKGYVSILLTNATEGVYFEGICIVSLIDSSDNSSFTQTFTIPYPTSSRFSMDKYISRKRLLDDPDDLLRNGVLVLRIEIQALLYPKEYDDNTPVSNVNFRYHFDGRPCELLLDSPLAKRLSELSDYFRAILVSPMIEMKTKAMTIQKNEMGIFTDVAQLVMGSNVMTFYSLKRIFDMYIIADKYDIPFISETSLCFLKLYASAHSMDELDKCVNKYQNESLKELLKEQINLLSKTNFVEEIMKTDLHVCMKQPVYEYLWLYTYSVKDFSNRITYRNVAKKYRIQKEDNYEHDFYK